MSGANPEVDLFLSRAKKWQAEFAALRAILLHSGLTEEVKWGVPCYTLEKKNVVLIHGFKEYCAILFFKGALLSDPKHILVRQTENVQASRQVRFASLQEIAELEAVLRAYVQEAVEVEKAGLQVTFRETREYTMPEEFQTALDETAGLKAAFDALTPGRQRAYLLHFSSARQSKTRASRVEQCVGRILSGKGLTD